MTQTLTQDKPHLSCNAKGPGPVCNLPSTIGYDKHDPSRYRSPAFTIRSRHPHYELTPSPGPKYDVYHLTNKGPIKSPAFSILGREKFKALGDGPGPGAYEPEKYPLMNHAKTPPAFSMISRKKNIYSLSDSPAPNTYNIPPCIGPKIPHKKASSAFTIAGRWSGKSQYRDGPGPGDYGNPDFYIVKKRYPAFSFKSRRKYFDVPSGCGSLYNPIYIPKKNSPMFSFGLRHSECETNVVLPEDNEY